MISHWLISFDDRCDRINTFEVNPLCNPELDSIDVFVGVSGLCWSSLGLTILEPTGGDIARVIWIVLVRLRWYIASIVWIELLRLLLLMAFNWIILNNLW